MTGVAVGEAAVRRVCTWRMRMEPTNCEPVARYRRKAPGMSRPPASLCRSGIGPGVLEGVEVGIDHFAVFGASEV
jgi:hypothetical protein